MKNTPVIRVIGLIFIITALLGILFSIAGITLIWLIQPRIQNSLIEIIDTADDTLNNTDEILIITDNVIDETRDSLNILNTTITNLDGTITSVSDSLNVSATLIGDDLRLTIINTQVALSSAATSAELIDNTLFFLASVPFIGADYQPEVPLHVSLEQVAGNLDDIPATLETMEQTLGEAADGLDTLNTDIAILADNMSLLENELIDAQDVLLEYQKIIREVREYLSQLRDNIRLYLIIINIFFSGIIFWLGIAQASILMQGINYVKGKQKVVNLADIQRDNNEN